MALKQLVEAREKLAAKQKKAHDIVTEAKGDPAGNSQELDFALVTSLKGTNAEKLDEFRKMDVELTALAKEVEGLVSIEQTALTLAKKQKVQGSEDLLHSKDIGRFATQNDDGVEMPPKGWGDLLVESDAYKGWKRGVGNRGSFETKARPAPLLKTEFTTAAGWAPESIRIGRVVDDAQRPIEVIDIVPGGLTTQAAVVYMEETTFTNNAAFRAESAAYAENAFELTQQSVTVRSIGSSIPVTLEQMADVVQVQSYLNNRMAFSVRQALDQALLTGTGTGVQWAGVNNFTGIQTQAKGADPTPDAFFKAMDLVRFTGRATPSNILMHSNDWQPIRLLRTIEGVYIWGNPSEAGPLRLWGLPVLVTTAQTENTGLVGDFTTYCQYFVRQDMAVEMGYVNEDFLDGRVTIRAGVRGALVGFRGAAFCTVTGI